MSPPDRPDIRSSQCAFSRSEMDALPPKVFGWEAVGASPRTGVLGAVDGDTPPLSRYPKGCPASTNGGGAMPADHTTLPVLAVIFLATVIRSAFGFGEALVAVPILALI